ncbi:TPA: DNA-directed RNA polymerase subunit H [Candidatus Bathyarchaeota archaeon]|nr:DNA-directed RNA polymerase subunit H [Candidatus Bathyarchaeota archaeon]
MDTVLLATRKGKRLIVFCTRPGTATVGVSVLRNIKKIMDETKAERGMIVSHGPLSFSAKNFARKFNIEVIPRTLPAFDLIRHELVPKHRILPPKEVELVLKKYKIELYQMPYIKKDDPIAILLGARPGDVIEVKRDSPTAGKFTSYRYVVR